MNLISKIEPDTSLVFTSTVVIAGILIVVSMLVLLILIFNVFGKLVSNAENKAKNRKTQSNEVKKADNVKPSAPTTSPAPKKAPAPAVQNGISDEVVAVITAAVAASEGGNAVIRSIKKKDVSGRNPWASSALYSNTRPF